RFGPRDLPFAELAPVRHAGAICDRRWLQMVDPLRYRREASLGRLANQLGAAVPIWAELPGNPGGESHPQDRRAVGDGDDLELQGSFGELFTEVREHLVDLREQIGRASCRKECRCGWQE